MSEFENDPREEEAKKMAARKAKEGLTAPAEIAQQPARQPVAETRVSILPDAKREAEPDRQLQYERFQTYRAAPGNAEPQWGLRSEAGVIFDSAGQSRVASVDDMSDYITEDATNSVDSMLNRNNTRSDVITKKGDRLVFQTSKWTVPTENEINPSIRIGRSTIPVVLVEGIALHPDEFNAMLNELQRRGLMDEGTTSLDTLNTLLEIDADTDPKSKKWDLPMSVEGLQYWFQTAKANYESGREYQKPRDVPTIPKPKFSSATAQIETNGIGAELGFMVKLYGDVKKAREETEQALVKANKEITVLTGELPQLLNTFAQSREYLGTRFDRDFQGACAGIEDTAAELFGMVADLKAEKDSKKFVELAKQTYLVKNLTAWRSHLHKICETASAFADEKKTFLQSKNSKVV